MENYLIIDGYNLLHELAYAAGVDLNKESLEEQREKLAHRIANYAALTGQTTELVFDAWQSSGQQSKQEVSGIIVVYTGKDETADTYIERYLYSRPRLAHTVLVTGDSAIQGMALLTGAERVSSRQFLQMLKEAEKEHYKYRDKKPVKSINTLGDHLNKKEIELFNVWRKGEE